MGWQSTRAAALAAWLLLPAAPAAALTTAVTAPVSGTRLVVDAAVPPTVHVEGTASAGASVDIVCVSQQTGEPDLTVVPIAAGVAVDKHAFATDATWPSDPGLCEVYAVAPGTVPTAANDLNGLQRSLVYEAATDTSSADGKVYDYATFMDGADGAYAVGSFGACPVTLGELVHRTTSRRRSSTATATSRRPIRRRPPTLRVSRWTVSPPTRPSRSATTRCSVRCRAGPR